MQKTSYLALFGEFFPPIFFLYLHFLPSRMPGYHNFCWGGMIAKCLSFLVVCDIYFRSSFQNVKSYTWKESFWRSKLLEASIFMLWSQVRLYAGMPFEGFSDSAWKGLQNIRYQAWKNFHYLRHIQLERIFNIWDVLLENVFNM